MNVDLLNFYSNLFTVEMAVFGIISAVVFVFFQVVYSQYPSNQNDDLFKNIYLICYFIVSFVSLVFTGLILYLLSFKEALSWVNNACLYELITNQWTGLAVLLSFFISLVLFFLLIFSNIKYLQPSKIILVSLKKLNGKRIINFILKRYDVPKPDDWVFLSALYKDTTKDTVHLVKFFGEEKKEPTEEEKKEEVKKIQKADKKLEYQKIEYQKWVEDVKNAPNPFEMLESFMWRSIKSSDLNNIDLAGEAIIKITKDFIFKHSDCEKNNEWSITSQIIAKYLQHIVTMFSLFLDNGRNSGLEVIQLKIIKPIYEILLILLKRGNFSEIKILLSFLKKTADKSIGKYPIVFTEIMEYYQSLGNITFKMSADKKYNDLLEEIFRHLGWLGERLLAQTDIEEKPLMYDEQYSSEYDVLINILLSYSYEYNNNYPNKYPLMYFDAIWVVFEQLVKIYKKTNNVGVKNRLFDCVYTYSSFAIDAIDASNNNGATLASMDLKKSYEYLTNEEVDNVAKDALELMVEVAVKAVSNRDNLKETSFIGWSIEDELKKEIVLSEFPSTVKNAIREVYIKTNEKHDIVFEFIKQLAFKMNTNFGFMFDYRTGEMYPDDDPRRLM